MSKEAEAYHSLPIPTYEEATSSRPHSSQSFHGPREISDDAERQGLLGEQPAGAATPTSQRNGNYQPPSAVSARSSYESNYTSISDSSDEEALRQDMEQMEVTDPEGERRAQQRARLRNSFAKRFATLSNTLSSLHLSSIPARLNPFTQFTSRIPTVPDHYKPSLPIVARLFAILLLSGLIYALVALRVFGSGRLAGQQYAPESVRQFVQNTANPAMIEQYLRQITYDDHLAGTKGDFFLAKWVEDHMSSAGLDKVYNEDFYAYLNYPKPNGRQVAIVEPENLRWTAALEEDLVENDSTRHQTAAFHGHSKSGDVTGPLVYANYGARDDFEWLAKQGINLNGSIALVRYYGSQGDRALKVKAAELAGAVGCLIYSDPADDGFRKGTPWPAGKWRPADSVQRGAVSLMSWVVGDVLTPGWSSTKEADRIAKEQSEGLVNIPSLPLAWRDAQILLHSLETTKSGLEVPQNWAGGIPDISYWTGNVATSPKVRLLNDQDESEKQPIRNVIGTIEGIESPSAQIYVGNHRDAWCFGAVDPGSGTAVYLEVVRIFGELLKLGWRPRRSIVFASWDGEEYNLIGSTEHVEDRIDYLRANAYAYLNVDVGVAGPRFRASASPVFSRALLRTLDRVTDPVGNVSLLQRWNETGSTLGGLGAGSDYVAFQDLAGVSSIDFGFAGEEEASFPYHSCYDTIRWMEQFGDQGFYYHAALAQVWALLILQLSDEPILPFDFINYALEVQRYIGKLKDDVDTEATAYANHTGEAKPALRFEGLDAAADQLLHNSFKFMQYEEQWEIVVMSTVGGEDRTRAIRRVSHNARMSEFETHLLDLPAPAEGRGAGGVPGREQFKHMIFGPQRWSGYDEAYFPAIRDRVEEHDWEGAQTWLDRVAERLKMAAFKLLN